MKRVLIMCVVLAVSACVAGDPEGLQHDDSDAIAAQASVEEAGSSDKERPVTSAATGSTWQYFGTESCRDFYPFIYHCTSTKPPNQCNVTAGDPCTQVGAVCAKVRSGNILFDEYVCD